MNVRNSAPPQFHRFMELPEHIQVKIMRNCDMKTVLSLSETCSHLHRLFLTTPNLTKRLKLVIKFTRDNNETVNKLSTILANVSMGRKYSKVKLIYASEAAVSYVKPLLLKILKLVGHSVKELELSSGSFVINDIALLLKCFNQTEKLILSNLQIEEISEKVDTTEMLPNLKELLMQDSKSSLLKLFESFTNLTRFKFHLSARESENFLYGPEKLETFILKQKELKILDISRMHKNGLFLEDKFDEMNFKLESLIANKFFLHKNNASSFFKKLSHLKLIKLYDFHDARIFLDDSDYSKLLRIIFSLPKLESVGIFNRTINLEDFDYLSSVRNSSVKFLEYDMWSSIVFEKIIEVFPKLEKIFFRCFTVKLRDFPVEKLSIMHASGSYDLEEFSYQPSNVSKNEKNFEENLKNFVIRHGRIRHMTLGHSNWLEKDVGLSLSFWIEAFYHLPDLNELVIFNPIEIRKFLMLLSISKQDLKCVVIYIKADDKDEITEIKIPTWCKIFLI